VSGEKKKFPRYFKDAIHNTNEDFDYGPFEELARMIKQNITVHTFAYSFREPGIYVFENSLGNTVTIIGVVPPS
jgi:hypothetical protein